MGVAQAAAGAAVCRRAAHAGAPHRIAARRGDDPADVELAALRCWPGWGGAARRPDDLDWVVLPDTWALDSAEAESLLDGFIAAIAANGVVAGEARIHVGRAAVDDIWT